MNPVTDPAKKSHEAKGVDKKKESHAPSVKDDKAPEPKPASNADDAAPRHCRTTSSFRIFKCICHAAPLRRLVP